MSAPKNEPIPAAVQRRVWTRIMRGHPSACWRSTWSLGSHGRPQIGWGAGGRGATTAARAVWASVHGGIPADLTIDHLCRNPACLNPAHLRLLPNVDNARDNRQAQRNNPTWVPGDLGTAF